MPLRTGTAIPWSEWDGQREDFPLLEDHKIIYFREGELKGDLDQLVEALRADGLVPSLYFAYRMAELATYESGWYGYVDDDSTPVRCDATWETLDGELVKERRPCVFAYLETET